MGTTEAECTISKKREKESEKYGATDGIGKDEKQPHHDRRRTTPLFPPVKARFPPLPPRLTPNGNGPEQVSSVPPPPVESKSAPEAAKQQNLRP